MFSWLKRKYKFLKTMAQANQQKNEQPQAEKIPQSFPELRAKLQQVFAECGDFKTREILVGDEHYRLIIAWMDNLASNQILHESLIRPLLEPQAFCQFLEDKEEDLAVFLKNNVLIAAELKEVTDFNQTVEFILCGESVIYIEGSSTALAAATRGWETRTVTEPETETVVRGPREGFVEDLAVNCALLRRKIKNPNLKMEMMKIGRQTKTTVCVCYLKGIADPALVQEAKTRLQKINIDAVLESGYLEEMIEDAPLSFFPTVGNSEKPDVVAAKILEGRVGIFCDGTPFVLTVPYLFLETLQASEDYYTRAISSSLLRTVRIICFYVSILLPGLYVAFLNFHQSVLPLNFLLTIAASRESIPFSPFTEALFMGITFEILQEAGIRMPRPIGQSVSIVGALVIGEASVRAGLVSDPMVIITALTAISTFILPPLQRVLPFFRFGFTIAANILGLLGIFFFLIALVIHLCTLRSFGIPYLAPLAPLSLSDIKDTFVRFPLWTMLTRPRDLTWPETGQAAKYRAGAEQLLSKMRKKEDR
ncbi:MAG TPA: spore germination protein [Peptococcaceae bacterium]|nr:spore germination protein [Peptococcaceae bacterium]